MKRVMCAAHQYGYFDVSDEKANSREWKNMHCGLCFDLLGEHEVRDYMGATTEAEHGYYCQVHGDSIGCSHPSHTKADTRPKFEKYREQAEAAARSIEASPRWMRDSAVPPAVCKVEEHADIDKVNASFMRDKDRWDEAYRGRTSEHLNARAVQLAMAGNGKHE